jgi:transposase
VDTQAYIASLETENTTLRQRVKGLEDKVMVLLQQIERSTLKKDSHNSHTPPSRDQRKTKKSLRSKSTRKSGGQPGHQGHTLKMSATPDRVHDLKSDYCSSCGHDLSEAWYEFVSRRQVIEIPPVRPLYEEYRQYGCRCAGCSHWQVADYPSGVQAPIQYGSSVISQVAYWNVYQYLPYKRCALLLRHVFGLSISEGSLSNLLRKAAQKARLVYDRIHERLLGAPYVGSDETSARVSSKTWWIWVWQTIEQTYLVASPNRGHATITSVFPEGLPEAVVGSDRWAAQLKTQAKGHQLCLSHLQRDVIWLEEQEGLSWSGDFQRVLKETLALRRRAELRGSAFSVGEGDVARLEHRLNVLLCEVIDRHRYKETARFQRSMIKYRPNLLVCLYDLHVPPDNNGSERALRMVKVKQKISGQFKTGQHNFCVLRSVIDTLIKRDLDVFPYLAKIMALQTT